MFKNHYFIIVIIAVIIGFIILFFLFKDKIFRGKKDVNSLKELIYEIHEGRNIYGNIKYHLKCDEECVLESKLEGFKEEDILTSNVDQDTINEILSILQKYHVTKWDGFHKSDNRVLDGKSFTFSVKTLDGEKVYAHGYMKYPKNYREVIDELIKIFDRVNEVHFKRLFDYDEYKDISFDSILKIKKVRNHGEEISTEEIEDREEIKKIYNRWNQVYVGILCGIEEGDYYTTYHFIMKDKEYQIKENYHSIEIQGKNYYFLEK